MDWNERIAREIKRLVRESPANRHPGSDSPYFDEPLVGYASLHDPLFQEYRVSIGNFHLSPGIFLESAFGPGSGRGGTVICWILPISASTRESNRTGIRMPSREWAYTRTHGEAFNNGLRKHLVDFLTASGSRAIAPLLSDLFRTVETPEGLSSTWSERHAAYAAGLGTFSLSRGFITERGIAHRCGSVITDQVIAPTPRRNSHFGENCLFYRNGSCGACIARCPAGAITRDGHDKKLCRDYGYGTVVREVGERYGVEAPGCGLCQTGVPCEAGIPG
ncbi:MAG: epoxyqueuosine reductase [Geobacteraceae bacterium]|nr:epoxyqueuosine reductase [Geobacteraceae bacterium]